MSSGMAGGPEGWDELSQERTEDVAKEEKKRKLNFVLIVVAVV